MSFNDANIGIYTGKCSKCSKSVNKKEYHVCSECAQIFCKEHTRQHPSDLITFCINCFKSLLTKEVAIEMEEQIRSSNSEQYRIKAKLKHCKKEKNDKIDSIKRLELLSKNNENAHLDQKEKLEKKIIEEKIAENEKNKCTESAQVAIMDSLTNIEKAKNKMIKLKEEYDLKVTDFDTISRENKNIQQQILEIMETTKQYVPYERLRNLGCEDCKKKIKSAFREVILNGDFGRHSIVQSVIAYRSSMTKAVAKGPNQDKEENDGCKCLII